MEVSSIKGNNRFFPISSLPPLSIMGKSFSMLSNISSTVRPFITTNFNWLNVYYAYPIRDELKVLGMALRIILCGWREG